MYYKCIKNVCRSGSSKVVVGNDGLNSKSVVGAICVVLSWKVKYIYTHKQDQPTILPYIKIGYVACLGF